MVFGHLSRWAPWWILVWILNGFCMIFLFHSTQIHQQSTKNPHPPAHQNPPRLTGRWILVCIPQQIHNKIHLRLHPGWIFAMVDVHIASTSLCRSQFQSALLSPPWSPSPPLSLFIPILTPSLCLNPAQFFRVILDPPQSRVLSCSPSEPCLSKPSLASPSQPQSLNPPKPL